MKTARLVVAAVSAVAAAVVTLSIATVRSSRDATMEAIAARARRAALQAQIAEWDVKVRGAERRVIAAERDAAELLSAVKSLRAQPIPLVLSATALGRGNSESGASSSPASPPAIDDSAVLAQRSGAAVSDAATRVMQSRAAAGVVLNDAEQARLAQERAYQQQLAKKRQAEAIDRAKFDEAMRETDAPGKFHALMQRAREQAARAEFSAAIRTFNEAMAAKPADVPVSPDLRELQTMLQAQNTPVEVAFVSDGETFVSVSNARAPAKFTQIMVKLLPGDYEVVGRRAGYRDVAMLLQVRQGTPAPVVTIICTQPSGR